MLQTDIVSHAMFHKHVSCISDHYGAKQKNFLGYHLEQIEIY